MALSTLRLAARPGLQRCGGLALAPRSVPMATTAHEQMKEFWKRNEERKRPNSPWIVYNWHFPMLTSLTHRVTGISMGVVMYGGAMGLMAYPGDFTGIVEAIKALNLNPALMFSLKSIAAFPLMYHYLNGMRHLAWDAGKFYELQKQYQTGRTVYATATVLSLLIASLSYW